MPRAQPLRPETSRGPAWIGVAALVLLTVGVYHEAPRGGHALDAVHTVRDSRLAGGDGTVGEVFSSAYWDPERFPELGLYRPLTVLSFRATRALLDEPVALDHALNVALHACNAVLVALLLVRLGAGGRAALLLAALHAVHPVHSEVVAGLVGRSDLMASGLALGALIVALGGGGVGRFAALFGLSALSLFAKESGAMLFVLVPGALVLREAVRGAPLAPVLRAGLGRALAPALALLLNLVARHTVLGGAGMPEPVALAPGGGALAERWAALAYVTFYFQRALWPSLLLPFYDTGAFGGGPPEQALRSVVGLALGVASAGWLARSLLRGGRPAPAAVALVLFWIAILPTSNLVFTIGAAFGERFLYFPMVFLLAALMACAACRAGTDGRRRLRPWATAGLCALVVAGGVRTALRVPDWRDNAALLRAAVRDAPGSFHLQMCWGALHLGGDDAPGRRAAAHAAFERAARLAPGAAAPFMGLGKLAFEVRDYGAAREAFEAAHERSAGAPRELASFNLAEATRNEIYALLRAGQAQAARRLAAGAAPGTLSPGFLARLDAEGLRLARAAPR